MVTQKAILNRIEKQGGTVELMPYGKEASNRFEKDGEAYPNRSLWLGYSQTDDPLYNNWTTLHEAGHLFHTEKTLSSSPEIFDALIESRAGEIEGKAREYGITTRMMMDEELAAWRWAFKHAGKTTEEQLQKGRAQAYSALESYLRSEGNYLASLLFGYKPPVEVLPSDEQRAEVEAYNAGTVWKYVYAEGWRLK